MKKNYSLVISFVLAFVVFIAASAAFAQEVSPKEEGHIDQIALTNENTTVTLSASSYVYDGKEKCPDVTVVYSDGANKTTLKSGTDYLLTYKNNKLPGKASAEIAGANDYDGKVIAYFTILPAKVTGVKADSIKYNSFRVVWNKQQNVSGYEAKIAVAGGSYKSYDVAAGANSYTFTGLKYDTDYTVAIRSFVNIDGKRTYSALSDVTKTATGSVVATPRVSGYCSLTSRPTAEWAKVKNAKSYVVYRSESKNGTYKKIGATKSLKFTDKKAKMHKTYYYKVRAVRNYLGKNCFSRFSSPVQIKALKTVLVGDSVLEGVQYYKTLPKATYVVKIGMGTYTFYESYYFKVKGKRATGCEKVISYKPDRVFMMFGMNETAYKGNKGILDYYQNAIDDIKAARPNCEIVLLPVSPTKANSGKSIPKKKRINSFNKALAKFAKKNGCKYYDYTKPFKDKKGNLLNKYDGGDGCHWKPSSCKLFVKQMNKYIKSKK